MNEIRISRRCSGLCTLHCGRMTEAGVEAAVALGRKYGDTDGAHHKQWVIDQMLRLLTGGEAILDDPGIAP